MNTARLRPAGFTITELVVVIVIATVLAAFAASRINVTSFNTEGFANEVAAAVRYAQKVAVSQHRTVNVTFSSNTLALSYSAPAAAVHKPPSADPFTLSAPSGVTLTGTTFTFNALGKPSSGPVTITVTDGSTPYTLTVEAETGYVH